MFQKFDRCTIKYIPGYLENFTNDKIYHGRVFSKNLRNTRLPIDSVRFVQTHAL